MQQRSAWAVTVARDSDGRCCAQVVALCQAALCRCTNPGAPCWPSGAAWNQLNASVGGRLLVPNWAGFERCFGSPASDLAGCASAVGKSRSTNFMNQMHAGLTESTGWQNGWDAAPSAYAVEAATVADFQAPQGIKRKHALHGFERAKREPTPPRTICGS